MTRPKYDTSTGEFKGLHETIGVLVVRGAPDEIFFNYVMIKTNPRSFIITAEGKFQVLCQAPYLIAIEA